MPSERRLHPATLLFDLAKHAKNFAVPAVLVIFGTSQSSSAPWGMSNRMPSGWEAWLLVLFVPAAIASIIRYLTFRLRYENNELVIRSGLIFRHERHVPFKRIQNVDAIQNVVHRLLGVAEVRVETGGGKEEEARLSVLPLAAVHELRARVFTPAHPTHQHSTHSTHGTHIHDAPWPMATALIVLAIGSVAAGWINIPHALGGHATLTAWLEPAFNATNCGQPVTTGALAGIAIEDCLPGEGGEAADHTSLELTLMAVSSLVAFAGIGLATFLWLKNKQIPERMAQQYGGIHKLLLNKYYVDEVYDATIVQPIKVVSTEGLWRGFDVKIVDGAVNGAGYLVSGVSIVLRLLQNGSVKTYAASMFAGVVAVLAYYLWR